MVLAMSYVRRHRWLARLQVAELGRAIAGKGDSNSGSGAQAKTLDEFAAALGMTEI